MAGSCRSLLLSAAAGMAVIACSQPSPSHQPMGVFPPAGDLELLFVRTQFGDDRAWKALLADATALHDGFRAGIRPVDDSRA